MSHQVDDPIADLRVVQFGIDGVATSVFARFAFALVVAYLVVSRLIADTYTLPIGVSLHPTDVILAALLATWLLWVMTAPLPFPIGVVSVLGAALMVTLFLAPYIDGPNLSQFQIDAVDRGLVRATLYAGLFLASYHLASSRRVAIRILVVTVAVTIFQASVALYELAVGKPLVILGSIWLSVGLEVDPRAIRGAREALSRRLTGELRVSGNAPHPLVLVGLLAVGIGICVALYLHSDSRRARVLLLGGIIFLFMAVGATNQRTAFVVLAVIAVVVGFAEFRKFPSAIPLIAAVVVGGSALMVISPNTPRLFLNFITFQPIDHNVEVRTSKYAVLPELLEQRPLVGAGFSTADPAVVIFDNGYLTELVELGILGFALLIGFLLVVIGRSFASLRRAEPADRSILLAAVLVGVALLAGMTTFDAMSYVQLFPVVLIVLAVGLARADELRRDGRPET
jgi:O-antigen ligase